MSIVKTHLEGGVAVVTLDDPDRRNAITAAMVGDIEATFQWLEHEDDCFAVVITGAPPAFCAGADLSHLGSAAQASLRDIYQGFLRIAESPLPTIAAINGAAVGAGVNMALCCDVILAAESARIDTRFVKLGLHPGGGHTWMMRNLIGVQATKAMVLFGDSIDGQQAARIGFAYRCLPDDQLLPTAIEMASKVAGTNRELVARVKDSIEDMREVPTLEDAVDHELIAQVWSIGLPGFQERLSEVRQRISNR